MTGTLHDLFALEGKVAMVTGASSGLGAEIARGLAAAGADVAVLARRAGRLEAMSDELRERGVRSAPVVADLTDWTQIERAVGEAEERLGPIDILVNNAGVAPLGRAEKLHRDQWDQALSVNLTAVFLLSQRVARGMIDRQSGGRVINVVSVMGQVANAVYPTVAYNASKSGAAGMTRQLAVEWARHGITVNGINPGWFPTEMSIDPRYEDVHPKYKQRMEELTPMGRLGREGELMGAVIFLASPAASYVTGTFLNVDGGWATW